MRLMDDAERRGGVVFSHTRDFPIILYLHIYIEAQNRRQTKLIPKEKILPYMHVVPLVFYTVDS